MPGGDSLDSWIGGDATRGVLRPRRIEIEHALLALLQNAVREDRLGVGARGKRGVDVDRLVRACVLDAECAPPRELAVANDRDRHGGHLGLLEPLRNACLPRGDVRFEERILSWGWRA